MEAQAADLMSQRLTGLAAFLTRWPRPRRADAASTSSDAVMDLTLAEQARRLGGPAARPPPPSRPPATWCCSWD